MENKDYLKARKAQEKLAQETLTKKLQEMQQKYVQNPSVELASEIDAFEKKMNPETKGSGGNVAAGMMINQAGGSDPLAQGLAAGVSTGNPLVGVGMGVLGGIQGAQQEKQRKANIDAQAMQNKAQNEQNTQMRRSAAIQSLAQNLSNSLLS